MCLIVSIDRDHSTDEVIDWLTYKGGTFERINVTRDIEVNPVHFRIGKRDPGIKIGKRKGWLRKNGFFRDLKTYTAFRASESFDFLAYLYFELAAAKKHYYNDATIEWVAGQPNKAKPSKTDLLAAAVLLDIDIPETHIVNNKKSLLEILDKFPGGIITKPITDVPAFEKDGFTYIPLTCKIHYTDLDRIPEMFFPSLIQEMIVKKYEIRSFYLDGLFYSAAIFSQSDSSTVVDFRNYNLKKPNRIIPYALPSTLESKLRQLFEQHEINCGSVDIMRGIDGKYYFLEINETGQFGMISKPCNLQIEKLLSSKLYTHEAD